MNIVFAHHIGNDTEYCFGVTDEQKEWIEKDNLLLVNTIRGRQLAIATSDVISGKGAAYVARKFGAYFPLKTVIAFATQEMVDYLNGLCYNLYSAKVNEAMAGILTEEDIPF